jgi:hypothetical protein
MGNNTTKTEGLPEGLGLRIRDTLLKILEIPVHEGKKVSASLKKEEDKIEAVIKIDLRNINLDVHNFIHSHFIRSDAINNNTNTRDLHYRIPDRYLEDVKQLHGLITSSENNVPEITKVLKAIDAKTSDATTATANKKAGVNNNATATATSLQPDPQQQQPVPQNKKLREKGTAVEIPGTTENAGPETAAATTTTTK